MMPTTHNAASPDRRGRTATLVAKGQVPGVEELTPVDASAMVLFEAVSHPIWATIYPCSKTAIFR
jgi:hypothetical protein